eukprot:COSAG02_NODE_350_length_24063_cov_47.131447_3_plen_62_part_00
MQCVHTCISTGSFGYGRGYEYGRRVWTEFTVFPYPIAFSDALRRGITEYREVYEYRYATLD